MDGWVADLGKSDSAAQEALEQLSKLVNTKQIGAKKAEAGRQLIDKAGGVAPIVRTVATTENLDVKEVGITCLIRLSAAPKSAQIRSDLVEAGGIPMLISALNGQNTGTADWSRVHHCAAGALGCLASGDEASHEAVCDTDAIQALVDRFNATREVAVLQECCTALANISYTDPAAVTVIQDTGVMNNLLDWLRCDKEHEDINQEKLYALQDAICGVLLNMCTRSCSPGSHSGTI